MLAQRTLGKYKVSAAGLGCMPMSGFPPREFDIVAHREVAISTIHAALDAGVTLLDTADIYAPTWNSMGHNEVLVSEGLRTWSGTPEQKAKVVIATKGGITRAPGDNWFGTGGRNADKHYLMRAVEASACRLGVSKIHLWQHHRLDSSIPFETQFENVLFLREHGHVEEIGLSNINAEQLRRAIKIGGTPEQGGVVSVQNEFSPRYRHGQDVLDICETNGIAFLPWSGLSGIGNGSNLEKGEYGKFDEIAKQRGLSPYAVTVAWHLTRSKVVIPIPGASKPESIKDTIRGADILLTDEEMQSLNGSLPPLGPVHEELAEQPAFRD